MRPKRASHIACSGSELRIRPCVSRSPVARVAPCGFENRSRKYSVPSSIASSMRGTETDFEVSPAAKVRVPEVAV